MLGLVVRVVGHDARVRDAFAHFLATNVPMGPVSTRPSSRRATITFCAVVMATWYSSLIDRIEGSLAPGGNSPLAMRSR